MKLLNIACLFAVVLTTVIRAAESKLSELFPLAKVTQFVFVDEVPFGDGSGYKTTKVKGATKGALAEAIKKESEKPYTTEINYPLIGILARVMLLDSNESPICTMEVVNWYRTVVFYGVTKKGGKNIIDDRYAIIESEVLARWVYEQARAKMPEEFKRMQEMYSTSNDSIESLLFPKASNSEQDGAGQPTTRPESKSEGGDKPQPEAEGRSR